MNTVAIYTRLSRDDYGERLESIETQKQLVTDFVNESFPKVSIKFYNDDNYSGVNFERPAMKLLCRDAECGIVNVVVAKDLSRLGRSNAKTLLFLEYMEELGVRVITADGRYDSLKNSEFAGIDSWFNERYVMDISRKIRANIKQKINSGKYLGTAPYGYRKHHEISGVLVPDTAQAEIVKSIFEMYLSGFGYKQIALQLDRQNILPPNPCRSKSLCWNPSTVKRILSNKVYMGTTVQGVSRKVSYKSKKTCRLPEELWVTTENTHAPIIDNEIFFAVQNEIARRSAAGSVSGGGAACLPATTVAGRRSPSAPAGALGDKAAEPQQTTGTNLLTGLVYCGYCGRAMFVRRQKHRPACCICSLYAKQGADACRRNALNIDFILKGVAAELYQYFNTAFNNYFNSNNIYTEKYTDKTSATEALTHTDIETLKSKQEKAYSDMLDGKISEDLFERINKNIEKKIELANSFKKSVDETICSRDACDSSQCPRKVCNSILNLLKTVAESGEPAIRYADSQDAGSRESCKNSQQFFKELLRKTVNKIINFEGKVQVYYLL